MSRVGIRISLVGLIMGAWGCGAGEHVGVAQQAATLSGVAPGGVRVWPKPYGRVGDAEQPAYYSLEIDNAKAGWVWSVEGGAPVADTVQERLGGSPPKQEAPPPAPPGSTQKPISCVRESGTESYTVTLLSPDGDVLAAGDGFALLAATVCSAFDPNAL